MASSSKLVSPCTCDGQICEILGKVSHIWNGLPCEQSLFWREEERNMTTELRINETFCFRTGSHARCLTRPFTWSIKQIKIITGWFLALIFLCDALIERQVSCCCLSCLSAYPLHLRRRSWSGMAARCRVVGFDWGPRHREWQHCVAFHFDQDSGRGCAATPGYL